MKFRFSLLLSILLCSYYLSAQTVTNVRVQQEGDKIVIIYDVDKDAYIGLDVIYGDELVTPRRLLSYAGEKKPRVVTLCGIYRKSQDVSGDVGRVKAGRNKRIVWAVLADCQEFVHEKVTFEVKPYSMYNGNKSFILAEYGYGFAPQHSAGITFGQCYGYTTIGWYVSVRTNLSLKQDDGLSCGQGGYLEDGVLPFYSGNTKNNHIIANAGMLLDFLSIEVWPNYKSNMLALYAGVGYGQRYQLWETTDHQWVTYQPTAYKGVSAECGLLASFKGFTLMAGVSTINLKYMEVEAGIGWTIFHKRK